jgi:hypothetical protein
LPEGKHVVKEGKMKPEITFSSSASLFLGTGFQLSFVSADGSNIHVV